uniref:Melatonin receptor type 1A n=1 Tax=Axis axis TaxID=30531 RepID=A0A5P9VKN5_AXIAX|nr:melatonin receptor 1a [Axis axis]
MPLLWTENDEEAPGVYSRGLGTPATPRVGQTKDWRWTPFKHAINRSWYICQNLRYSSLYRRRNALCCVFRMWMLTLMAIVPNLCVGTLKNYPRVYSCTFTRDDGSFDTIAEVAVHFIIPILVDVFCYLRIWDLVLQDIWMVKPGNQPKMKPLDFKNFVTMFVGFVLFTICWAPLNFIGLVLLSDPCGMAPTIPKWLFVASYYMAYFNSCLNAIIYGLLNQNFSRNTEKL